MGKFHEGEVSLRWSSAQSTRYQKLKTEICVACVKKLPEETIVIAKILFRLQGINLVMHKILKGLLQVGDQIN